MKVWLTNYFKWIMPALVLLCIMMFVDYISGMLAAKKEAVDHPNNKRYGWSSKKSTIGIYKKVGYMITIFVTFCLDYILYRFAEELKIQNLRTTFFGFLTAFWFLVSEAISILENVNRMGVKLPHYIEMTLAEIQKEIDD